MPPSLLHATEDAPAHALESAPHALKSALDHAAHMLPAQGPITVFIHHNTLHAFEHLPFDEGVQLGSELFGCQPYLSEDRYRQMLTSGRILEDNLAEVLRADLGPSADERLPLLGKRFQLRLAMLEFPVRMVPTTELRWFVAETDALESFRPETPANLRQRLVSKTKHWVLRELLYPAPASEQRELQAALSDLLDSFGRSTTERWSNSKWEAFCLQSLWRVCCHGVQQLPEAECRPTTPKRHRDLLLESTGQDSDAPVHELLIRACSAFLDQGLMQWQLPLREEGFFKSFCKIYGPGGSPEAWQKRARKIIARWQSENLSPADSILESLEDLGVPPSEFESFITQTMLALRGWAGMIRQVETRPDRAAVTIPEGSLQEFLAIRLLLERSSLATLAKSSLGYDGPLAGLRAFLTSHSTESHESRVLQRAFPIFQLVQLLGILPEELVRLNKTEWFALVQEIEAFNSLERRRIFQSAFERNYRDQVLQAIAERQHQFPKTGSTPGHVPAFQLITCLDEREESFRRHVEEAEPAAETFGAAGFFGVAVYYRGIDEANFVPLCPVVIRPKHWITEEVGNEKEGQHRRRAQARRVLGTAYRQVHLRSRTFLGGALVAALGVLASVPLVFRVLFPLLTSKLKRRASTFVRPPQETYLQLERTSLEPGSTGDQIGYAVDEMATAIERLLRDIGLTKQFAPLVIVTGHGSGSLNNPHKSAYDCGACGGGRGGPNARAFARMANDPRVRLRLAANGIQIPAGTYFVGGFHDTCSDKVTFFDPESIPESHAEHFAKAKTALADAQRRNAHERCRRFVSAPLTLSADAAFRHVDERQQDLAQTRPECGHATNAVAFVGRRECTRGLYMDRRTFLVSYDPLQDNDSKDVLKRILDAIVPVCSGINLEYYFSYVDPVGWGCSTKLPHNITSLLGVMDGAASDLRPGLPWQMVEIHEPMRLLFVLEATPETAFSLMARSENLNLMVRNQWVQLAVMDPDTGSVQVFESGQFAAFEPSETRLPHVRRSADFYRGCRDHLGFAEVVNPDPAPRESSQNGSIWLTKSATVH